MLSPAQSRGAGRRPYRLVTLASAVLITVAGCGGGSDRGAAGAPAARPSTPSSSSSSSSSSPSSPSATPTTPGPGALPKARDGRRLSACRTGRCEVLVRKGDTLRPPVRLLGADNITVTRIAKDGVSLVSTAPDGFIARMEGQTPGTTSSINKVSITTVAVGKGKAIVRLAPKK